MAISQIALQGSGDDLSGFAAVLAVAGSVAEGVRLLIAGDHFCRAPILPGAARIRLRARGGTRVRDLCGYRKPWLNKPPTHAAAAIARQSGQ